METKLPVRDITDDLVGRLEKLLDGASDIQRRWVAARVVTQTNNEAAALIGRSRECFYRWPNRAKLEEAARLLRVYSVIGAAYILEQGAIKAAQALVDELDNKPGDPRVRVQAALAILDRVGLSPRVRHEVGGLRGEALKIEIVPRIDGQEEDRAIRDPVQVRELPRPD